MFSIFTISVILPNECSVIPSLIARLLSLMDHAPRIPPSLSISQLIYSFLESYVILTEHSMSAVLVTENVLQEDAMASLWERLVLAQQTAILISTAIFRIQGLANQQLNLVHCATLQICVIWVPDVGLTLVQRSAGNAYLTSHFQVHLVSPI